jgi:hypothetical protein
MKLLEILLENTNATTPADGETATTPAATSAAAAGGAAAVAAANVPDALNAIVRNFYVASQRSHTTGMAREIKNLLSQHTLVTGYSNNQPQFGGRAYIGPIDDNWGNDLSEAILRWKRSINLQIEFADTGDRPLDVAGPGVINQTDLRYLRAPLRPDGTIRLNRVPTRTSRSRAPVFDAESYVPELGSSSSAGIESIEDMVEAIGWSGWYRLSWEVHELTGRDNEDIQSVNAFATRFILEVYKHFNRFNAEPWIDNWNKNPRTLGNQSRVTHDVDLKLDIRDTPKEIYEKFAPLLRTLWQEDLDRRAEGAEQRAAAESGATTITNVEELTNMARTIHDAMHGGTGIGTDNEQIGDELQRLRSRGDWEALSERYNEMFQIALHEDIYNDMEDTPDLYARYVTANLVRIRVINHLLLHSMINFGREEFVEVVIDDTRYRIQQQRDEQGNVVIEGYDGFDDIVIDRLLRAALEAQGTEVPTNLEVETTADNRENAAASFLAAIESRYPEMAAWYGFQPPFDDPELNNGVPDLGGLRMRGIVSQGAEMFAVGVGYEAVQDFMTVEIGKDRGWLIGTGEDSPGVANIRFADAYGSEGDPSRWLPEAAPGSDITLDEEEQELLDALLSDIDSEIEAAISDILNRDNKEQLYIRLYDKSADQDRKFLDEELGNDDTVIKHVERQSDNSHLQQLIERLRTPVAAPNEMAKLFAQAAEGDEGVERFFGIGTDDDLMIKLIDLITGLSDYNLVDYRYRSLSRNNNSLIDDMADEQWLGIFGSTYYNRLAEKIGREQLETVRAQISSRLRTAIDQVGEDLTEDNVDSLETAIEREGTIGGDKILPLLRALDELVQTHHTGSVNPDPSYARIVQIRNAFAYYDDSDQRGELSGAGVLDFAQDDAPAGYQLDGRPLFASDEVVPSMMDITGEVP